MAPRLFKIRMRSGRAMLSATKDGTDALQATSDEEVVVSEHAAAFLVRDRAADVIEVLEQSENDADQA